MSPQSRELSPLSPGVAPATHNTTVVNTQTTLSGSNDQNLWMRLGEVT